MPGFGVFWPKRYSWTWTAALLTLIMSHLGYYIYPNDKWFTWYDYTAQLLASKKDLYLLN